MQENSETQLKAELQRSSAELLENADRNANLRSFSFPLEICRNGSLLIICENRRASTSQFCMGSKSPGKLRFFSAGVTAIDSRSTTVVILSVGGGEL